MPSIRRGVLALLVAGGAIALGVRTAPDQEKSVRGFAPDEIHWSAEPGYPPGYARVMLEGEAGKTAPFTYRVRLPAGFRFQPHTHAGDEHVTVLQGAWSVGIGSTFDASRLRAFPVGSFVVIPAGTPHFVATESDTIIQVHGIGPIAFQPTGDGGSRTQH
jgi:quercetin dioxygenase-like cupin family protein